MSSCHLSSADSAVGGSVEVPGKECNINARVSFCFPDGHLSHLQHNIQTQRSKQGLYSFSQHTGEHWQTPKDPSIYRQSQHEHP